MADYSGQRAKVTPPHVSLADLRTAVGITLDEVCRRIREEHPNLSPTRGAISAIEHGHRGASVQMLAALETALGLRPRALTTDYEPRQRDIKAAS